MEFDNVSVTQPSIRFFLSDGEADEPVRVMLFRPELRIEGLDKAVVIGFAGLGEVQRLFPTCGGTELTSIAVMSWCQQIYFEWYYILPRRSKQNGCVGRFNGRMRDELLDETGFRNLAHARSVIVAWAPNYNTERAHLALECETPADYARTVPPQSADPLRRMKVSLAGRLLNPRQMA